VRRCSDEVVTEIDIPTLDEDTGFQVFLQRNDTRIRSIANEYHNRFGYVKVCCYLIVCLLYVILPVNSFDVVYTYHY